MQRRMDLREEPVVEEVKEEVKATGNLDGLSGLFGGSFIWILIIIGVIFFLFGGFGGGYGYSTEK